MGLVKPRKNFRLQPEKKFDYANVTYRLPVELIDKIKKCASEHKMSCCKVVEQITVWGMEAQKKNDLR